jgi:ribulose bisphosphate carboxylase small subunit
MRLSIEQIPLMDDYKGFKLEVNYSNQKAVESVNVILDFSRLSKHFPERLRLTEHFLQKIYSIHSKEFISEVQNCLTDYMNDFVINMILSY